MPVKPDSNSEHLQLAITSEKKFHQTLTVIVKNSNVMVQPTFAPYLHITMHPSKGTDKRKNCHLKIEKQYLKKFDINTSSKMNKKRENLVEWNRNVPCNYESPLELIFASSLIESNKAELFKYDNTKIIDYSGALYMNFWFTTSHRTERDLSSKRERIIPDSYRDCRSLKLHRIY